MEHLLQGILLIILKPIIEKIMNSILDRFSPGDTIIAIRLLLQSLIALAFAGIAVFILYSFSSEPSLSGADTVGVSLWMAILIGFLYLARKRWFQFRRFYKMH